MKTSVIQLNSHQLNRKVREDIILSVKVTKVDILLRSHQTCMSEEAFCWQATMTRVSCFRGNKTNPLDIRQLKTYSKTEMNAKFRAPLSHWLVLNFGGNSSGG